VRRRRTWLAALGVAAAAIVVGVCVTVAYGLSTGFERAAHRAGLPDVIVRFDATSDRGAIDARLRTLPGLEARSYRLEATNVFLDAGDHSTDRGSVHVVEGGRRGYAVVAGHDLDPHRADVLVEPGLARAWGLHPGSTIFVGRLGELRVAGEALEPDNVAYPVASAARVYVGRDEVERVFGRGDVPVSLAQLWLHRGASVDVALTQARAQSFGIRGLAFITRSGVRTLVGQAAGIVVALLVAFSLVALGAAAVMLGTAAHADVQRRLPGLAVRRALGFPRASIARAAAARAAAIAVPAAAAGLAVGWALVRGPTGTLLATLNEVPPGAHVLLPLGAALLAIVALVVACATWPAWRATAAAPAALLRGGELRARTGRGRRGGGALGAAPAALGARLVAARRARFAGVVAVLGACAAVVLLMLALASLLERLRDDPATLGKRYALTVHAEPTLVPSIRAVPGVRAAAPRWQLDAAASFALGEDLRLVAFPGDHVPFEAPPLATGRRLRNDGEAEVGVGLADALGLAPGGTLGVQLPNGREARFRVAGVVRALDNEGRIAYVRPARLRSVLTFTPAIAVKLDPGVSAATVSRRLDEAGFPPSRTAGAAGSNGNLLGVLGDVLRVVAAAVGVVMLYALVQALALTAAERRPTLALLRSLGAPPRTIALVLAGAGVALVVPAALLAIALEELVLAPLVTNLAAGYADLQLSPAGGQIALVALGLAALAVLAAAAVARRVRREPIAPALREAA
jgi:ABC-type lipoprotein release transport system permease subunit